MIEWAKGPSVELVVDEEDDPEDFIEIFGDELLSQSVKQSSRTSPHPTSSSVVKESKHDEVPC